MRQHKPQMKKNNSNDNDSKNKEKKCPVDWQNPIRSTKTNIKRNIQIQTTTKINYGANT